VGLLVLLPGFAFGAGFYMTENGTKTLLEGGAFVGEADDVSAMAHNPAGLANQPGFSFLADGQLLFHSITFQREDPGFDPSNPPATNVQPVNNVGGPFVLPMLGVAYGFPLFNRTLTIAAGVYGPPSVGHYDIQSNCVDSTTMMNCASPDYTRDSAGKYIHDPRKWAPQRYTLLSNSITIVYPTLSLAYAIHPRFQLGVSLQPVLASFSFRQAITSNLVTPTKQSGEDPIFDSIVNVNLPLQYVGFTGIAGVMVKPVDWLSIGASVRPPIPITAKGNLNIDLGEAATALNTTVMGDQVQLQLKLPLEIKAGVHVQPIKKLGINFDFVYQGWQSVQDIVLTPENVSLKIGSGAPMAVAPFDIHKGWTHSAQFHLGGGYQLMPWLSLHAGGWYETGAIPDSSLGVDFLHPATVVFTGGLGFHFWGIDVYAGAAGSPTQTIAVTNSTSRAGSTDPTIQGSVVGNGIYTTGTFMATIGVRGHFGGASTPPASEPTQAAPPPSPEGQAPPPPAENSAPDATPAPAPAPSKTP
jgi:hypothetical protein